MASAIDGITGITAPNSATQKGQQSGTTGGPSFLDVMKESLGSAVEAQHKSEQVAAASLLGKASMTDVLQATTDAEVALKTVLAVRDRLVQAWQEIMRSQI